MSDNKYFVDINNLNRFWSNAKEYIDNNNNNSLEYVYIPSVFDENYTLESSKYYDFGLSSELNIVLEEKLNNDTVEYNFQFRSGNIATKLNINGRIISDTERYCIHRVKVVGGMVDIAKSETPQYFCIEQIGEEACNINFNLNNPFELSVNGEDWMSIPANSSDINIPFNVSRYIYIRSNATITSNVGTINSTGLHKLSGNIMSLIYGDDFKGKIDMETLGLPDTTFQELFKNSTGLIDSSCLELSPKILTLGCYRSAFDGCSSMINSPELNIEDTDMYCYWYMFKGCSNLRKIVMSSNTQLNAALQCFGFLNNVPDDNTRTIYINSAYFAYTSGMPRYWKYKFIGEPNYHIQPLTFNVLSEGSFSFSKNNIQYCIFSSDGAIASGWNTLTAGSSTPTIAAGSKIVWKGNIKTSSDASGIGTFSSTGKYSVEGNIMSLLYNGYVEQVDLTDFNYVFYRLFYNSTKLIDASNLILPATTLANGCYSNMFYGCSKLTTAPALPATTLTYGCYENMFYNCTSLTTAPELCAAILADHCYYHMFYTCDRLKSITMLATDISAPYCLDYWIHQTLNLSGEEKYFNIFKKHPDMTSLPTGASGIPEGWSVYDAFNTFNKIEVDYSKKYLTFEAVEDCDFGFDTEYVGDGCLSYSVDDGSSWRGVTASDWNAGSTVRIQAGSKIMWKSDFGVDGQFGRFTTTGKYNISGNIMSLLYEDDFEGKTDLIGGFGSTDAEMRFAALFAGYNVNETFVVDAGNLILPATTLTPSCYFGMFMWNPHLIAAPKLPATTLADSCYLYMFNDCSSLTTVPELPATTLTPYCYHAMFAYCTSLTTAPALPATTLADYCYDNMFNGCTSLTTAPELPATTLVSNCYSNMFYECTSLTIEPELPATTLVDGCYSNMFRGCTSLTTAPELPATTLAQSCYSGMFSGCSKLNNIVMLATDISASYCLDSWVDGVASTGTFTRAASMASLPTGISGIPSGWSVVLVNK